MPTDRRLPALLENLIMGESDPQQSLDQRLTALMQTLCQVWSCERCFLCLRDPQSSLTRITHSHCTRSDRESLLESSWMLEDAAILSDPLMILAFQSPHPVYVEDVKTADASTIDLAYEQQVFKSRALIHAPIYAQGQLYGILEPCVFDQPRIWTEADRWVTVQMQQRLSPLVLAYLKQAQLPI
jgi:GAF domain-containing protein